MFQAPLAMSRNCQGQVAGAMECSGILSGSVTLHHFENVEAVCPLGFNAEIDPGGGNQIKMRILYDHQVFSLQDGGGISRYYFELIRSLASRSACSCDVLLGLNRNTYPFQASPGESVWQCRSWIAGRPGILRYAINHAASSCLVPFRGGYDIYHPTLYRELQLARHRKVVTTHHDCAYEHFPSLFRNARGIVKMRALQFAKADAIICPSQATRADLHRFYDVPEHKTFVVYHGIAKLFTGSGGIPLRSEKPFVLYVGSRAPYKNFGGLLAAFAAAGLQRSFDIIAVGGGSPRRDELDQIQKAALTESVHFVPRVSDEVLAAYYAQAHLLVYPSLYEGFGFPPLEAMDLGCPVLAASASCLPEICGPAACFFDPNCDDSLIEALKLSCYDEEWRHKAIALGKHQAKQYTWDDCAENTLAVYKAALSAV